MCIAVHGGWETSALRHPRATDQIGKCTADCCSLLPQTNALCVVILCIHITVHTRFIYDFPVSRPHRKPPGVWLGVYRYPAYNEVGVPNLQKCRVPIFFNNTELSEVSGTVINKTNFTKCRVLVSKRYRNLSKCRAPVSRLYQTNTGTPGFGFEDIPVPKV